MLIQINKHVSIKEMENDIYHVFFDNYRIYMNYTFKNYHIIDNKHYINMSRHKAISVLDLDFDFPSNRQTIYTTLIECGYSVLNYNYKLTKHENILFIKNIKDNTIHTLLVENLIHFKILSNEYFCVKIRGSMLVYDFETISLILKITSTDQWDKIYLNNDKTLTIESYNNVNSRYSYRLYNLSNELLLENITRTIKCNMYYYNKEYKIFIEVSICGALFVYDIIRNKRDYIGIYYQDTFYKNIYFYNYDKNIIVNMSLANTNYKQKKNLYKITNV